MLPETIKTIKHEYSPESTENIKYEPIEKERLNDVLSRFPSESLWLDLTLPVSDRSSETNIPRLWFFMPNGDELGIDVSYNKGPGEIILNTRINNQGIWDEYPILKEFIQVIVFNFEPGVPMTDALEVVAERMCEVREAVKEHIKMYETKSP